MSLDVIGVIMIVLFITFYWLNIFATIRALLAFGGVCILGTTGFLGSVLGHIAEWLANLSASASGWAVGVSVAGLLITIPTLVVFIHDLHPKHAAGKRTGWAGILLAALLVTGVSGIAALNKIPADVRTGVTNAQTAVTTGGK